MGGGTAPQVTAGCPCSVDCKAEALPEKALNGEIAGVSRRPRMPLDPNHNRIPAAERVYLSPRAFLGSGFSVLLPVPQSKVYSARSLSSFAGWPLSASFETIVISTRAGFRVRGSVTAIRGRPPASELTQRWSGLSGLTKSRTARMPREVS